MAIYTTTDILGLFGIKKQRFRQWLDKEYIIPDLKVSTGSGDKNLFNRFDLYRISLFIKLINIGLNRYIASEFAKELDNDDWVSIEHGHTRFMVAAGEMKRRQNWKDSIELYMSPTRELRNVEDEVTIVMDLHRIIAEVNDKLEE
ncbi:hypothetical protein ACFL43_02910 [Thermodesulfobacteriota bacterium]